MEKDLQEEEVGQEGLDQVEFEKTIFNSVVEIPIANTLSTRDILDRLYPLGDYSSDKFIEEMDSLPETKRNLMYLLLKFIPQSGVLDTNDFQKRFNFIVNSPEKRNELMFYTSKALIEKDWFIQSSAIKLIDFTDMTGILRFEYWLGFIRKMLEVNGENNTFVVGDKYYGLSSLNEYNLKILAQKRSNPGFVNQTYERIERLRFILGELEKYIFFKRGLEIKEQQVLYRNLEAKVKAKFVTSKKKTLISRVFKWTGLRDLGQKISNIRSERKFTREHKKAFREWKSKSKT